MTTQRSSRKAAAAPAAEPAPRRVASQADIHETIYNAIVEHRLLPGTKLAEEKMAELFAVSRTQVRGALQRLAVAQLVTLVPHRGAFVTTPTADDARDVLWVRRTLEPAAMARLIERIAAGKAPSATRQLRALVQREQQAHARGDRRKAVRLSGEFHVLLAELSGSPQLARMVRELTPLTCLAILAFDAPTDSACPNDEHSQLIDAIERRDTAGACRLMEEHLEHIERSLRLDGRPELEIDLAEALLG
ncbi:GntR family transcriptional regulator [Acidovorax sp. NCPPB 3859]|nr:MULTISPECIES: GntR family transcriptional regulator [unclassified Acidovorax]MDA8449501.1 GntR family transcriptional regulator [Acidovorax sp. GBBC 3297]MDA8458410.1 GntR family transcriptional regulator [Acidovorax sp. GBBC 3333]MDA8463448.1 GntR family transcriptional regulator [Acidovorax sp. GBBC 3332]MDA8468681.1 GntR family transcriptional regulator [Acidovorax sp. GBBC 3299]WCM77037.1 GntR family transcriptional regulator [Acidovorax sp. GBBC 712]